MEYVNSLTKFISNLSTEGLVLLITVSVCIILLIIITVVLAGTNLKLRKIINNTKNFQTTDLKSKNVYWENNYTQENNIKKEKIEDAEEVNEDKDIKKYVTSRLPIFNEEEKKTSRSRSVENTGLYEKNILRSAGNKNQLSPITINRVDNNIKESSRLDVQRLEPIDISLNDTDEDDYYENINKGKISFVEEISEHLSTATDNLENIEVENEKNDLDEYERNQEENAIISYEELIKSASNNDFIDELEEEEGNDIFTFDSNDNIDFLNELKSFRSNL